MYKTLIIITLSIQIISCSNKPDPQKIVDLAIEKHGGILFESKKIKFDFRDKHYTVEYKEGQKIYTRTFLDDSLGSVNDILINSAELKRYLNDTLINVNKEWQNKYANSINSVLYFFQLPYGLNEPAVNKEYIGEQYINNKDYHKIKVTFKQEGGGEDFQDVFIYWINKETKTVDYLAYSYVTDEGGTRFRQAINRRNTNGMIFQDYINYKPVSKNIIVDNIDKQFIDGNLIELSRIENDNIIIQNP